MRVGLDSHQQRLRLSGLGHLVRRSETLEGRRENGVSIGVRRSGRLMELCERERGAQFEAAGLLALRDGDGGEEGFLCGRGDGGGLFEQDLAANAMEFGVVPTLSEALGFSDCSRIMAKLESPASDSTSASIASVRGAHVLMP